MPKDNDTHLYTILDILKTIHQEFYSNDNSKPQDVKEILSSLKCKVLKGCHIVFSGLIPLNTVVEGSDVWRTAIRYGATCTTDVSPPVTHLVAAKAGTGKVNKVLNSPNVYLVNPAWFYDSVKWWKKANEYLYPVDNLPVQGTNGNHYERPAKKQKTEQPDTSDMDSNPDEEELLDKEMSMLLEQEFAS